MLPRCNIMQYLQCDLLLPNFCHEFFGQVYSYTWGRKIVQEILTSCSSPDFQTSPIFSARLVWYFHPPNTFDTICSGSANGSAPYKNAANIPAPIGIPIAMHGRSKPPSS